MDNLPEPLAELDTHGLPELRPLSLAWPMLLIRRLEDKPQNPIISSLERAQNLKPLSDTVQFDQAHVIPLNPAVEAKDDGDLKDIWLEAMEMPYDCKNHVVSWDTLRSTYLNPKSPSPFISEQPPDVVMTARNSSRPASSGKTVSINIVELRDALSSMLAGCASVFYGWNADEERFVPINDEDEKLQIVLDGMDEIVSESYVSRFVEFGTLLRRLEIITENLRRTDSDNNSTVFAFAYALSSALIWIRGMATDVLAVMKGTVCNIWVSLQEIQDVLLALASLCFRDLVLSPKSYQPLPRMPQRLLSHVYDFLARQVEQQAPRTVRAILSYILTVASRPYFISLARSIGLVDLKDMLADARRRVTRSYGDMLVGEEDGDGTDPGSEIEIENGMKEEFPSFMSGEIQDSIIRAQRSIRILSSPEFETVQVPDVPELCSLEWAWTDEEVSRRALGQKADDQGPDHHGLQDNAYNRIPGTPGQKYKPELAGFAAFDLEPGSLSSDPGQGITNFILTYPAHPPSLAPTLPLLAEHVLIPVSAQASALGRAALQRFLTPGTSLHFRAHLVLLRAYLLLTAPAFKARLTAALFSDADADEYADEAVQENPLGTGSRTRAWNVNWRRKEEGGGVRERNAYNQVWPVGLAFGLTGRGQWPPEGSELALFLRRVIMDSLEDVRETEIIFTGDDKDELADDEFWDEAENRLGFAIRDLPDGTGREKWLDPTLIEALDFLYMQYRPPTPLRCLITTDILSKYQRVFAFLLRLLRVETAMRLAFRLTRPHSVGHIFADYPNAQNLVQPLRFAAQAFLSAFSAYVADTAIRGNVDAFIARVRYAEVMAGSGPDGHTGPFVDVYALMQRHSRTLDAVLAACLLRGAQRVVGDIMRALLEVILEFAVLIGNAHRFAGGNVRDGVFDEQRAATRVEALYAKFCKTRDALVKALRKIKERGSKPFASEGSSRPHEGLPSASGGMEALSDLLLRLGDFEDRKK